MAPYEKSFYILEYLISSEVWKLFTAIETRFVG